MGEFDVFAGYDSHFTIITHNNNNNNNINTRKIIGHEVCKFLPECAVCKMKLQNG